MDFIQYFKNLCNFILLQDRKILKSIAKRFFKLITMIISLCGLIYQVQIIYVQYMSGKTVINLEIGRLSSTSPPAITICFQALFSMERAEKFDPGFKKINKIYQDLWQNNSMIKFINFYK